MRAPLPERSVQLQASQAHDYDTISISSEPTEEKKFMMELVSRLSQEVRTATSISDIQALRTQVAEGRYKPDPAAIAARMLLIREA